MLNNNIRKHQYIIYQQSIYKISKTFLPRKNTVSMPLLNSIHITYYDYHYIVLIQENIPVTIQQTLLHILYGLDIGQ